MHARAWCLAKKKELETSSLPPSVVRILVYTDAEPHRETLRKEHSSFDLRFFIGSKALLCLRELKKTAEFLGNCTLGIVHMILGKQKLRWMDCLLEMQDCWSSSLLIVSFISFLVGVILTFQAAIQFQRYGAGILVVDLVSLSIVREMGPIMAAIVVAGGTGAGFAAQLGNMKVDEEIDALQTFGISVVNFLVLPRFFAITIMMPILTIYSNVLGILGGMYISATMLHIPTTLYWNEMHHRVSWTDISSGLIKSFFFGMIIALAGCLRGIQSKRNTAGVGHATSSAVVTSIMLIILTDALFSLIYNALGI
jgi:phospholipid/cholesterol/gamma-HCH transport system permease protein